MCDFMYLMLRVESTILHLVLKAVSTDIYYRSYLIGILKRYQYSVED